MLSLREDCGTGESLLKCILSKTTIWQFLLRNATPLHYYDMDGRVITLNLSK